MKEVKKDLEMQDGEHLKYYNQSLLGNHDQNLKRQESCYKYRKSRLSRFQLGAKIPLAIELEAMYRGSVTLWQKICLKFSHGLRLCTRQKLWVVD